MNAIKTFLRQMLPPSVLVIILKIYHYWQLKKWRLNGCKGAPPHIVKQLVIKDYQRKSGHSTLVETGTFTGEMVEAQKKNFKRVISIELGDELFEKARMRFKNDKNVLIVHGDSGKVLPGIMADVKGPAIFWLDGHYSSGITAKGDLECPIFEELNAIFGSTKSNHIILIDDARHFNGERDYPSIETLENYVKSRDERYKLQVKHDIIRISVPVPTMPVQDMAEVSPGDSTKEQ